MKNWLKSMLFLAVMGAQASTYYRPGLYGNALSGLYAECFSGTSIVPLYTQLLQPPAWSSGFAINNTVTTYHLDPVFAQSSWVNSGLTQYTPKAGGLAVSDTKPLTNSTLLGGNALWSINSKNLASYITNNSTTGDLAYYNAAVIEYFSARLAMASSAFIFSPTGSSDQNSFLNVLYPSSNTTALQERAIVYKFLTAAENLFSWSRYLRNITVPDSIGLATTNGNSQITQASGFTLGALETFAGLIVINTSNTSTSAISSSGVYGIQQVVIPSGQPTPVQVSNVPAGAMPTISPAKQGLINPLTYPIAVDAPLNSLAYRFMYPGFTSFAVALKNQNNVSFLPVSTQVYGIAAGGTSLYAVQEPADNWANAPVATQGSFFRQVAFQTNNTANYQTSLSGGSYILGVGVMGGGMMGLVSASAATTNPLITFQSVNATGYNQSSANPTSYTSTTVDNLSCQVPVTYPTNFFEDKQPWAVVVTVTSSSGALQAPAVTGVVKLNSFDFPLMFAQDPLAQGYTANPVKDSSITSMTAPNNKTYGKKKTGQLLESSLLPALMEKTSVSLSNSCGIAFSQRDVWMGISNLYALTLQANLGTKNVGADFSSTNYSFAYMFLQALFNGHLYSTTASSLYSIMKTNNEIIGETQEAIPSQGVIGNLTYDYVTESKLPLYSLPISSTPIAITNNTPNAKGIWPINEPRKEPQASDWLQQGTPLDWLFLRALMVGRTLMENTGITAAALPYIQSIITSPTTAISGYIPQVNTVINLSPSTQTSVSTSQVNTVNSSSTNSN